MQNLKINIYQNNNEGLYFMMEVLEPKPSTMKKQTTIKKKKKKTNKKKKLLLASDQFLRNLRTFYLLM